MNAHRHLDLRRRPARRGARLPRADSPPATELIIVGASRGAADDLARAIARQAGRDVRHHALQPDRARGAGGRGASGRRAARARHAGRRGSDGRARGVRRARRRASSRTSSRSRGCRDFPKALARTLHELRLAGVRTADRSSDAERRREPGDIGSRCSRASRRSSIASASTIARRCSAWRPTACRAGQVRWATLPIAAARRPARLARRAGVRRGADRRSRPTCWPPCPTATTCALDALRALGGDEFRSRDFRCRDVRRQIWLVCAATSFRPSGRRERERAGDVVLFSAPGEGREAVEIVRRVLDEAGRGVPFDEMAVFLRTPQQYLGLLEHACARGGVPVYFDRGTRRPDPAGRAFVALLSCAVDGLSAKRFDEYLSLGQVPQVDRHGARRRPVVTPLDEVFADEDGAADRAASDDRRADPAIGAADPTIDSDDDAIVAGTLRSPWKWEELIVESAVVGGRTRDDGKARWRRRLDGLAADFSFRIDELKRDEPESARIARFERDLQEPRAPARSSRCRSSTRWPSGPTQATWGEWLERFSALAARALRRPDARAADARRSAADGRRRSGDARGSARRAARSAGHARLGAAGAALRPPVRRHAASGARPIVPRRVRARAWPSAWSRSGRARIRCCSTTAAARSIAALVGQDERSGAERLLLKLAIGAATRAAVSVVSAARRRRNAGARAVVLRARRDARDHRPRAGSPRAGRRRRPKRRGASLAWPAPKDPGSRDRRSRARPRGPQAAARRARSGDGQGPRALSARAERVAAALGDQPLGARARRRGRRATA